MIVFEEEKNRAATFLKNIYFPYVLADIHSIYTENEYFSKKVAARFFSSTPVL